jgi:uncharacterized cupredoxin-like copper-binding protein
MAAGRIVSAVLLAACAGPADVPRGTTASVVTVVLSEYRFTPSDLTFNRGTPYRLHLENRGRELHEFTAPDFFKAIEMRDTKPLNPDKTEIVVQPGQHKNLYFVAKQPGKYDLRCSDHDWAGMVGDITIAP